MDCAVAPASDVEIRPARHGELRAFPAGLGDRDFFADRMARQADGRGILLTAWATGRLIGTAYLWREPADEPEIREHLPGTPLLNHVQVLPGHRNRLIGAGLVTEAEGRLAGLGHDRVALAVRVDNTGAERLYRRLGYRRWDHGTVECCYEVRHLDGSREARTETCHVLVKGLTGNTA